MFGAFATGGAIFFLLMTMEKFLDVIHRNTNFFKEFIKYVYDKNKPSTRTPRMKDKKE